LYIDLLLQEEVLSIQAPMDPASVKARIDSGDFDFLLGLVEDARVEGKAEGYKADDLGRSELAKDVCAFANREGGIIIIGVQTARDDSVQGDRIRSFSPFGPGVVDPIDYFNVLKEWIYPALVDLAIQWRSSKNDLSRGLVYIFVPNQPEQLRPFLIRKDIDPVTGRRRKEMLFGLVERVTGHSISTSIENLHTMIRIGRENRWRENMGNRVAALEARTAPSLDDGTRRQYVEKLVRSRVLEAIKASQMDGKRVYCICTSPQQETEVQTLFSSAPDSIATLLEHPPQLRYGGWGMDTNGRSSMIAGRLRRAKVDGWKILDLYRDGILVFVCTAGESLLGWGPSFGEDKINSLVLIEMTYMYFNFYHEVLQRLSPPVHQLRIDVQLRNLRSEGLVTSLTPDGLESIKHRIEQYRHRAPESNFSTVLLSDQSPFDATKLAYQTIREIYFWFGLDDESIPYVTHGTGNIDVERLRNPRH
jgi:hypothetical protein